MIRETLIHIDEKLNAKAKNKFLNNMVHECGDLKPRHHSKVNNMTFVAFEDTKVTIHDLFKIAKKYGTSIEVIDF